MASRWFVIGISGVTGGGKSTLAYKLKNIYPRSHIVCMDTFFLSSDDPRHIKVAGLNHNNWERLGAIDVDKWKSTINSILDSTPEQIPSDDKAIPNFQVPGVELIPSVPIPQINTGVLILDGFLALNEPWTVSKCNVKFYIELSKEECWERRQKRNYDPPDIPGYFESCVWPEHLKMKEEVIKLSPDVVLIDGSKSRSEMLDIMLNAIATAL